MVGKRRRMKTFGRRMTPSYCFLILFIMSVKQTFLVEAGSWNKYLNVNWKRRVIRSDSDSDLDGNYCQDSIANDGQPVQIYPDDSTNLDTSGSGENEVQDLIKKFNVNAIPNYTGRNILWSYDNKFRMDILIQSRIVIVIRPADNLNLMYAKVHYPAPQRTNIADCTVRHALRTSLCGHKTVEIYVGYNRRARRSGGNDIPTCSGLKLRSWMSFHLASIVLAVVFLLYA